MRWNQAPVAPTLRTRRGTSDEAPRRGFTLIETVIALALLAAGLIALGTLFVLGSRTVKGARELTQAANLATRMVEQMDGWPYAALYGSFGRGSGDAGFEVDTLTDRFAGRWQPQIDERLPGARAVIRVDPVGGSTFVDAKGVRFEVTLHWTARQLPRRLTLTSVRF